MDPPQHESLFQHFALVKIVEPKSRVISKVRSRSRSNIFIKFYPDLLELIKNL